MNSLQKKIDFALVFRVTNANPNGDPLNGNRPRVDFDGLGEITDVCIKRKIRDRLVERYKALPDNEKTGQAVFVQSDDRNIDGETSLRNRAESDEHGLGKDAFKSQKKGEIKKKEDTIIKACTKWFDVRAFGQVFAFGKSEGSSGVSIPIRGPVTIQSAFSVEPVTITSTQITKSVSGEGDGSKRGSDTMGMKHRVDHGIYRCFGSMNPQLAERTGFSDADAQVIKEILPKLFENDASTARPEGSMAVIEVFWWEHDSKIGRYSSARVHGSLKVETDGSYKIQPQEGLEPEVIEGF
uniref:CRISPR-associated protein, Csd2 family n=1 Tax=Candidatus Kentrum sp. TUN TaxID=2126343 RepID=A0A450ZVC1_9GAMM|nr:MAG: CRISPR-associated protein, Csd2 family [Candidatus Kentron sp. TUN]